MSHGHSHGAHSCSSEHNHDDDLPEGQGPQEWSLYQYIFVFSIIWLEIVGLICKMKDISIQVKYIA